MFITLARNLQQSSSGRCFPAVVWGVVCALVSLCLCPLYAYADVRKGDVLYGKTVETRDLSVAQCPNIDAEYACVMDANGTIYFDRSANTPTQIASITKIMTAVVTLDAIDAGIVTFETPVVISEQAAYIGESSAGFQKGDITDIKTALTALLVPSGNDAAQALAETVGAAYIQHDAAGDNPEAVFVARMNEKAADLGCTNTVYENPQGLDFGEFAGDLHSSAADVAKVVRYAMSNSVFREDVARGDTTIQVVRNGGKADITLEATNEFLELYPYAIGVKTGFTELSGASFAAASNNGNKELYVIVINSTSQGQRFLDAQELCEWTYKHAKMYSLANSAQTTWMNDVQVPVIAEVAHQDWVDKTIKATLADPSAAIEIFDLDGNVSQSLTFNNITGNVRVGDKVGTIEFKQHNKIIASMDLVACESLAAPNFLEGIGVWWDRLFRNISGKSTTAQSIIINETPLVSDKTDPLS